MPVIIITSHLYMGHIYLFNRDSDQHESFGYFGLCANINNPVHHLLFIICQPTDLVSHLTLYQHQ